MRRAFDPSRYKVVLFDQRGCGRSTPHASDPSTDLASNTTHHLIADMERLRAHLNIERWLVSGGSWGSTLALVYAQAHPTRVSELVISGVTMTRRSELAWLYGGVARFFPEEWRRFREAVGVVAGDGDVVAAYARLMEHPDPTARARAADAWCAWEDAVVSLEGETPTQVYSDPSPRDRLAFVRICAHYFSHAAWLEEGALLRDAHRLAGIPGVLLHGRLDLGCPFDTAYELAQAWPDAQLIALRGSGHLRSAEKRAHLLATLDRFADRRGN